MSYIYIVCKLSRKRTANLVIETWWFHRLLLPQIYIDISRPSATFHNLLVISILHLLLQSIDCIRENTLKYHCFTCLHFKIATVMLLQWHTTSFCFLFKTFIHKKNLLILNHISIIKTLILPVWIFCNEF